MEIVLYIILGLIGFSVLSFLFWLCIYIGVIIIAVVTKKKANKQKVKRQSALYDSYRNGKN